MRLFRSHPQPFPDSPVWRAQGVRAVDGDTVEVLCDLGFDVSLVVTLRVEGVNCPEVVGAQKAAGIAAREFTASYIEGKPLLVTTRKFRQTFTRYVARVQVWIEGDQAWADLSDLLVEAGHATPA